MDGSVKQSLSVVLTIGLETKKNEVKAFGFISFYFLQTLFIYLVLPYSLHTKHTQSTPRDATYLELALYL